MCAKSVEQQARDLLEGYGLDDAQSMTAGDLVELANLIAAAHDADHWKSLWRGTVDDSTKLIKDLTAVRGLHSNVIGSCMACITRWGDEADWPCETAKLVYSSEEIGAQP